MVTALARRWAMRLLALLSGAVLALAFPAVDAWWLGWIGLIPVLLLSARSPSYAEAAWRCALAAVGFHFTLYHWLLPHLGVFTPLVGVLVGVFWVPFGLAARRLLREPLSAARVGLAVVVLPSVWVAIEVLRSWKHLGGTWGLLGLSQWQVRPVLAVASLGGVWLLSALLVAVNVGLAAAVSRAAPAARLVGGGLAVGLAACAVGYGLVRPEPAVIGTLRVAVVQPGVVHDGQERFAAHLALTRGLASGGQDVVVWGQSSVAFDPSRHPEAVTRLRQAARRAGSDLLVNVDARGVDGRITKSTHQYDADGLVATYAKQRLVPFGEYVPLRPVLGWLARYTNVAELDRATGETLRTLRVNGRRIGPLVSYESLFPDLRRGLVRMGADVTVVQGSLTTFHGTWAQAQQASFEAVRAVESGRSAVLVELSGTSAAFDARGRELARMPSNERGTFLVEVPIYVESTPYVRWGDWTPVIALIVTAASILLALIRPMRGLLHRGGARPGD